MKNLKPYEFDNFIISDNPEAPVFDLKLNRPQTGTTEKILESIKRELGFDRLRFVKTVLRELSPVLLQKESLAIVSDFVAKNFRRFVAEKRLDFYLHPDNINEIKNVIAEHAERLGYEGRIFLHKDDSIAPCDCRVVWSSGEAGYNSEQILAKLEKMLAES